MQCLRTRWSCRYLVFTIAKLQNQVIFPTERRPPKSERKMTPLPVMAFRRCSFSPLLPPTYSPLTDEGSSNAASTAGPSTSLPISQTLCLIYTRSDRIRNRHPVHSYVPRTPLPPLSEVLCSDSGYLPRISPGLALHQYLSASEQRILSDTCSVSLYRGNPV